MTELVDGATRTGVVTAFDVDSGLGTVTTEAGTQHLFHCLEIADGSRDIEQGARVSFELLAKFGRFEAANLRP